MRRKLLHIAVVSFPKLLGGLGTVGLNLVLLHRMNTSDLAIFAMLLSVVLLVDGIAGSAIDLATLKLDSLREGGGFSSSSLTSQITPPITSRDIQKHALLAKIGSGVAAALIVLAGKSFIWVAITGQTHGGEVLYLTCACATGLLMVRSVQVQMQLKHDFVSYGILDSIHLLLRFGFVALCFWLTWVTPVALLLSYSAAPLAVFAVWVLTVGREVFSGKLFRPDAFRLLFSNVNWLMLTFSLSAIISRMDLFLTARWSSLSEAGLYAGGQSLAMLPQLLGLYMSVVFGPKIMPKIAQGTFFAYFRNVQSFVLLLAVAGFAVFCAAWSPVAALILPSKYQPSSDVIRALVPGALAGFVTFPLTLSFLMFVRPRFLFTVDCIALPFLLILYYYLIPAYGAVGAAWTTTGAALVRASIAQVMAWHWARSGSRDFELSTSSNQLAQV